MVPVESIEVFLFPNVSSSQLFQDLSTQTALFSKKIPKILLRLAKIMATLQCLELEF